MNNVKISKQCLKGLTFDAKTMPNKIVCKNRANIGKWAFFSEVPRGAGGDLGPFYNIFHFLVFFVFF